jgi:hypothetical protein
MAVGTSGAGIIAARLASGRGSTMDTCLMLAGYFITTSLIAALGLILHYRLEKAGLQARDSAARRGHELSAARLELQRGIIDKVQDGGDAARAYQSMTAADALYALSRSGIPTDESAHHGAGQSPEERPLRRNSSSRSSGHALITSSTVRPPKRADATP